jgi:transcription elongation GreA/GreB family factor
MKANNVMDRNDVHASALQGVRPGDLHSSSPTQSAWNGDGDQAGVIGIGSTVAIRDLHTDEREEYALVQPDEADICQHRISSFSPLGRAIYGRKVGDIVRVEAPSARVRIRIEAVLGC